MRYERADVVVVGGGLLGCLVAWRAVERRLSVVMVEKGRPSGPQEALPVRLTFPDLETIRDTARSLPLWQLLEDAVGEQFFSPRPSVEVGPRKGELEELYQTLLTAGRPAELLPLEELRARNPRFSGSPEALGLLQPEGGLLAPALLAIWARLQKLGVNIYADTEVRMLDLEHEQPTAVAADTAFRGRFLVATAGLSTPALLQSETEPQRLSLHTFTFGSKPEPLPLFALATEWGPVRGFSLQPGSVHCHWRPQGLPEDRPELFVKDAFRRWLPEISDPAGQSALLELKTFENPIVRLAFRPDILGLAGLDRERVGLAPALADQVLDEVTQVTPARG